jgi:hypothetical protein
VNVADIDTVPVPPLGLLVAVATTFAVPGLLGVMVTLEGLGVVLQLNAPEQLDTNE